MKQRLKKVLMVFAAVLIVVPLLLPATSAEGARYSLNRYFQEAAAEYDVPVEVLMAVGYAESRWNDHQGKPSQSNGYGIMHLVDNPEQQTLRAASRLTGVSEDELKIDIKQNIRGAAAVLADIAKQQHDGSLPKELGQWYTVVAEYAGYKNDYVTKIYADEVFRLIEEGVQQKVEGEKLKIHPTAVHPDKGIYRNVELPVVGGKADAPVVRWAPAHSSNFTEANREADGNNIDTVVIHTTQGSYSGAISWFQNPNANVSAHYVIRSSDGEITQSVSTKNIAWHAGNWSYNVRSIGIEHEGYVDQPGWYTDAMYQASAHLTRYLCDTFAIPRDRNHIIGHSEVPGATHTDPGPLWDWNRYMALVNQ